MAKSAHSPGEVAPHPVTLLFVCIANVCRSPTMQFLTAHHLSSLGIGASWILRSAGTDAAEGDLMCATAAKSLRTVRGGTQFATAHRATPLDRALVESADLILVATQLERPLLTRLSAGARERTFTMVEGALLAEAAVRTPRLPWREDEPLRGMAANMHAARGSISLPRARPLGQLTSRTGVPESLDVSDVHGAKGGSHARTLADLRWASKRFALALAAADSTPGRQESSGPPTSDSSDGRRGAHRGPPRRRRARRASWWTE